MSSSTGGAKFVACGTRPTSSTSLSSKNKVFIQLKNNENFILMNIGVS
jgi:hypothetical protein